jgi:hypothetical protein
MFLLNTPGGNQQLGGCRFEELFIIDASGNPATGCAFNINNSEEVLIDHCFVQAMNVGINVQNGLNVMISDYTYLSGSTQTGAAIVIGGPVGGGGNKTNQANIRSFKMLGQGAPTTQTGILVQASEGLRVSDGTIQSMWQCITLQPQAAASHNNIFKGVYRGVECNSQDVGVLLLTTPTGSWIADQTFEDMTIQGGLGTGSTAAGFLISLGRASSTQTPANQINNIECRGVRCVNGGGAGFQFDSGQGIRLFGGGANSNTTCGLLIDGPVADLLAYGMDLTPNYNSAQGTPTPQPFAVIINGATGDPHLAQYVRIIECDMRNYTGSPVSIVQAPVKLLIFDCPGYNDLQTAITGIVANVATAANLLGYYGWSRFAWAGNTGTITITTVNGSQNISASDGSVWLHPYDTLKCTILPTTFMWTGY